jgi:plastocyanin
MLSVIATITFVFLIFVIVVPAAYAEDIITIIPCSSNHNNPIFFDTSSYYVQKGQHVRWFNADDINHRIIATTSNGKELLFDSGLIKPNGSYSYNFNNIGSYNFSSPIYPWMKGNVSVTDDMSSGTIRHLKDNVDVQLAWTPITPKVGQTTHFKIIFLHKNTELNQPHIDYVFSINNLMNKTVYQKGLHSSWGVESASYKFDKSGRFMPKVTMTAVLFQPVYPSEADFKMSVTG